MQFWFTLAFKYVLIVWCIYQEYIKFTLYKRLKRKGGFEPINHKVLHWVGCFSGTSMAVILHCRTWLWVQFNQFLNFELDFSQVHQSLGPNLGSGPNHDIIINLLYLPLTLHSHFSSFFFLAQNFKMSLLHQFSLDCLETWTMGSQICSLSAHTTSLYNITLFQDHFFSTQRVISKAYQL